MSRARVAVIVTAVIVSGAAYRWWTSDERAIRKQMSAVAESLSVPAAETDLRRVTRLATLGNALAPDVRISADAIAPGGGASVTGRDTILGLVSRWTPPADGVAVDFVDVQVTVNDNGLTAQVYCTAKVSSGPREAPNIDAHEVVMTFSRIAGVWRVTAAALRTTFEPPGLSSRDNRSRL
jgi:hypothetical protein